MPACVESYVMPAYSIRESTRAQRVCLRVTPQGQVEVVVPRGFDQRRVPDLVRGRQAWLKATLERVARSWPMWNAADTLPDAITLHAIAEIWQVTYTAAMLQRVTLTEAEDYQLILRGNTRNQDLCKAVLQRWLLRKAQQHLVPWLEQLGHEKELPFKQARVRGQKTRWGSCSRHKVININYKLLFLPAPLVRCVLIHELCHTVHMNHSPKFWALMAKKQPDYAVLGAGLRKARHCVPRWAE